MSKRYDVIVVGAGNGGLAAACTLSQMGFKTLLVEKHNCPGGCAASFVRGRFEFEASLHNLPYMGKGEARGDIGQMFDRFGVNREFYEIPEALHFIVEGENGFEFKAGVGREAFAKAAEERCPGCSEAFWRFCDMCDELNAGLAALAAFKGKPDFGVLAQEHPNYLRLSSSTVQEMFDALEIPTGLQQILSVFALYQLGDVSKIDAARYMLMTDSFIKHGAYQTDLRSSGLSAALAESARRFGCDIWYDSEVERILTENGRASGIRLKDGREVGADYVILNVMPSLAYNRMLAPADIPEQELKKTNARVLGARAFCVYLGLNRDWRELGIQDYALFINPCADNAQLIAESSSREGNGGISVNCLNAVVPNASPEGTCILYITSMFGKEAWDDVTPENYTKLKEDFARKLIERYERAANVDVMSHIEEIAISTPLTYARYLGTPDGSVFGYSAEDWDGMLSRNMGEAAERGVPGIAFVGGHGTRLSGFSPSYMSGMLTALRVGMQMKGGAKHE